MQRRKAALLVNIAQSLKLISFRSLGAAPQGVNNEIAWIFS